MNGVGIVGVWPGARALNVPLPSNALTCSASATGVQQAIDAGASVINMSYGSQSLCRAEYNALQRAVSRGIVPVAAAGNEFASGNPPEFPASLPHVLTVAAVNASLNASSFSNANQAVDLSAPGENIMTAVPPGFDTADGTQDGFMALDGTSFSAPMVAAAVAWVRAGAARSHPGPGRPGRPPVGARHRQEGLRRADRLRAAERRRRARRASRRPPTRSSPTTT